MSKLIQRMMPPIGLEVDDKEFRGYAIIFYDGTEATEFELAPGLRERIDKRAADKVLETANVVIALDHDMRCRLGDTASGTAELSIDSKGVRYRCPYDPEDRDHVYAAAKIRKGLVKGSSFAGYHHQVTHTRSGSGYIRNVGEIDLVECGPVYDPAYKATDATLAGRSLITAQEELELYLTQLEIEEIEKLK